MTFEMLALVFPITPGYGESKICRGQCFQEETQWLHADVQGNVKASSYFRWYRSMNRVLRTRSALLCCLLMGCLDLPVELGCANESEWRGAWKGQTSRGNRSWIWEVETLCCWARRPSSRGTTAIYEASQAATRCNWISFLSHFFSCMSLTLVLYGGSLLWIRVCSWFQ